MVLIPNGHLCRMRFSHALIHNFSILLSYVAIKRNENHLQPIWVSIASSPMWQAEADCFLFTRERQGWQGSYGVEGEQKKHITQRLHSSPFVVLLQLSSGGKGGLFRRKLDGDFEVEFIRNHLWDNGAKLKYLL